MQIPRGMGCTSAKENVMHYQWILGLQCNFFGYINLNFPLCVSSSSANEYNL